MTDKKGELKLDKKGEKQKAKKIGWGDSKKIEAVLYAVFGYMLLMFLICMAYRGQDSATVDGEVSRLFEKGEYSLDESDYIPFVVGKEEFSFDSSTLCTRGNPTREIMPGEKIWIYCCSMSTELYVNHNRVFIDTNALGKGWTCYTVTRKIDKNDLVEVRYKMKGKYLSDHLFRKAVKRTCIGSDYELLNSVLRRKGLDVFGDLLILALGISLIIYYLESRSIENNDSTGILSCAFMLIVGALTCFIDREFITQMVNNLYFLNYIDNLSQYITALFMVQYLQRYLVTEKYKIRSRRIGYTMVILIVIYMFEQLIKGNGVATDLYSIIMIIIGIVLFSIEMRSLFKELKKDNTTLRMVIDSAIILSVAFLAEMIYYVVTGDFMITALRIGLVIFAIVQWIAIAKSNINNAKMAKKANELEKELTQSQIQIMMSQIQPHFLYNALGTIRALTVRHPEQARSAIDDFSKYLRANMDSLKQIECIPFNKELEHAQSYLNIEQLRFGDLLNVEYDIKATNFELPALTLQTMAENAVKHGLLAKEDGGTLTISTSESSNCFEVKIADNGIGFDMNKPFDDSRSHVGIANTKQRISAMCGGTVSIGSKPGEGTVVTIVIPKKKKDDDKA